MVLFAGAGGASAAGATASHLHVMRLENVVRLLLSRLFFAFHNWISTAFFYAFP